MCAFRRIIAASLLIALAGAGVAYVYMWIRCTSFAHQLLHAPSPEARAEAADHLKVFGASARARTALLQALSQESDADTREAIVYALPIATECLPVIARTTQYDPSESVRAAACEVLELYSDDASGQCSCSDCSKTRPRTFAPRRHGRFSR